jgi:hypothetical protein
VIEPETTATPEAVAEAPNTTTTKQQVEDPTKLDQSGDESAEASDQKGKARKKKGS